MPACVIHQPSPVCGYRSALCASCVWAPSMFSAPPCSSRGPTWWPSGWAEPWRASSSNTSCLISVSPWWRSTCRLRWPNNLNHVPSSVALSTQEVISSKETWEKSQKIIQSPMFCCIFLQKNMSKMSQNMEICPLSSIQNDLKEVSWGNNKVPSHSKIFAPSEGFRWVFPTVSNQDLTIDEKDPLEIRTIIVNEGSRMPQMLLLLILVELLSENTDFLEELQSGFRSQHGSAAASLKQSAAIRLNCSSWFSLNPVQRLILLMLMPWPLIWKGWSASHAVLHPNEAKSSVNWGEHVCDGHDRCYKEAATAQYSSLCKLPLDDIIRRHTFMHVTAVNSFMWVNSGKLSLKMHRWCRVWVRLLQNGDI